ncbi:hypothetical protein NQ317_000209 [Molorchus minor]|uniref:Uncharacterized protein n=1 Tax=Molorchus minor TaxID=1323400 RepID=A0ABQ9JAK1_9CUCU|nr:hypothetical protein NQ317_000209 [Molorchus minor]
MLQHYTECSKQLYIESNKRYTTVVMETKYKHYQSKVIKIKTMNNYKLLGRAGEGAHGFVFKGMDLRTNTCVALKKNYFQSKLGCSKKYHERDLCFASSKVKSLNVVNLVWKKTLVPRLKLEKSLRNDF